MEYLSIILLFYFTSTFHKVEIINHIAAEKRSLKKVKPNYAQTT